jgi:hypothetical protein
VEESSQIIWTICVILKNLSKVNIHPKGENSPNLVTPNATNKKNNLGTMVTVFFTKKRNYFFLFLFFINVLALRVFMCVEELKSIILDF